MAKEMVISANPHETRVAIMEEGLLCEFYVERQKEFALVGSIYKGRVTRVLPGMQSAFVEIGLDSDAFLYVTDFLEGIEEFDPIVATVEEKVKKMEEQGGQVFAPVASTAPAIEPVRCRIGTGRTAGKPRPSSRYPESLSGNRQAMHPRLLSRSHVPRSQFAHAKAATLAAAVDVAMAATADAEGVEAEASAATTAASAVNFPHRNTPRLASAMTGQPSRCRRATFRLFFPANLSRNIETSPR